MGDVITPTPTLPATLTNAGWQKGKGLFAKFVGETGVGAALAKVEEAYHGVNWVKFIPSDGYRSEEAIEQAWHSAREEGAGHFPKIRELLVAARDLANKTAEKYDNHPRVPKGSSTFARKVATDADSFWLILKSFGDGVAKDFEKRKVKLKETQKIKAQIVIDMFPKIKEAISAVKKDPTAKTYNEKCWQKFRLLSTQIAVSDWATPYKEQTKTLSSVMPTTLDKKELMLAHIKKVEELVGHLEHLAPK